METRIFARNMKLNSGSEEYVRKKMSRLERHLREDADAKLELSRTAAHSQTERFVAQMTVTASGATLRGQESAMTLHAAIDKVADVMDRQIRRYKGKAYRSAQARRAARERLMREDAGAFMADGADDDDGGADGDDGEIRGVARVKRFPMKPMSVEDAVMEMELLDHDFFLFRNIDTNECGVVYRRRDGDYGVIEPTPR